MTVYLDLNTEYTPKNFKTSPTIDNMEDIKASLLRLFMTPVGSVPFNRNYGSHLYELLFENNISLYDVRMFLYNDIQTFEPRIQLSPMDIYIEQTDEHTYAITCQFVVPALNDASSVSTSISDQN